MSEQSGEATTQARVSLVALIAVTGALSYAANQYVDSVLLFGGTECDTMNGIQTCVGYPPTGIVIIVLLSALFVGAANKLWDDYYVRE